MASYVQLRRGHIFCLIGRGGEIRTPDPHNPIVVRYQAALRPDRHPKAFEGGNDTYREAAGKAFFLTPENLKNLFKFQA